MKGHELIKLIQELGPEKDVTLMRANFPFAIREVALMHDQVLSHSRKYYHTKQDLVFEGSAETVVVLR